jgi:hypothetical protein
METTGRSRLRNNFYMPSAAGKSSTKVVAARRAKMVGSAHPRWERIMTKPTRLANRIYVAGCHQ